MQNGQSRVTVDDLFRRAAARRPEAIALADAPNRASFTDGPPLRLTYAEADRMVSAIAGRLRQMGLPTDAIVGIQLPNTVENILTILGVLRAGMIAAPLPLLWRQADAAAALARVGAKAFISCGHVGKFEHCQFALRIAAEVFSIRYVCGFGAELAGRRRAVRRSFHRGKARSDPAARARRRRRGPSRRRHFRDGRSRSGAGGAAAS